MAYQTPALNSRILSNWSCRNFSLLAGIGAIVLGCSSSDNPASTVEVGGANGAATGGSTSAATGGSTSAATGGLSQGGTSNLASSTGGNSQSGGSSSTTTTSAGTGGAAVGGAATGGATSTGGNGVAAGGRTSTGGTSSTSGGSVATGGTEAGGAASDLVTPKMISVTDYQLTLGSVVIDINPQAGARVSKLAYATTDIIKPYTCASYDATVACNSSGSTFWTSPQSAWDGVVGGSNVWPPVAATDGNPYTAAITGTHLVLTGSADTTLGASVTKDISADAASGWITLTYTITATKAIQVAPWQISRVARGGIIFFPLASLVGNSTPPWTLAPSGTTEWIDDTNQTTVVSSNGSKVIADGGASGQSSTWLAYALGGNLFLIKYPNVASTGAAPSEADTEIYPGSGFIELEVQGTYASLATNATSTWTVQWRVVPIPSTVTVAAGSSTLLTFAQTQAGM